MTENKLVQFKIANDEVLRIHLPNVAGAWFEVLTKLPIFEQNMNIKSLERKYPNRKKDDKQGALFEMEAIIPYIKDRNITDEKDVKIPLENALDIVKQLPLDDYMALSDAIYEKKKS